jgi:phosphoribosylformylglycinamidine synthase
VGAGGLSNAFPELTNDAGRGARFDLRAVQLEESGMAPKEIWSNESQERYVLAIAPESLEQFKAFCERERCPFAVIGVATEERQLVLHDPAATADDQKVPGGHAHERAAGQAAQDAPRREDRDSVNSQPMDLTGVPLQKAVIDVLAHPTVASKRFLITIGDRTVGGLSHRDQMVGPWQVPVADCAVTLADYKGFAGEAMSMGERTPLAAINAPPRAAWPWPRPSPTCWPRPSSCRASSCPPTGWPPAASPAKTPPVRHRQGRGHGAVPALGISIPVGKDSLSMRTQWQDGADKKKVTSPVSLIVSAFASLADVRGTLTPQLNATEADTTLVLIDLGKGQNRMGGSILGQTLGKAATWCPIWTTPRPGEPGQRRQRAARQGQILAYHDRSDGGLLAAVAEMAFAGHVGVALNVDMLVTEGDGISDSRMDTGDAKNWAGQVSARREELTLKALFNEELGVVLQVRTAERNEVMQTLREHGLSKHSHFMWQDAPGSRPASTRARASCRSGAMPRPCSAPAGRPAPGVGQRELEDLPAARQPRLRRCRTRRRGRAHRPRPARAPHVRPADDVAAPFLNLSRPKVAILREQGVNSHVEMAYAFTEAGFEAFDVHMTDLQTGRAKLEDFKGVVACGGFSYGDTLGAGIGWARSITFNPCWPRSSRASLAAPTPLAWACATAARCLPSWPTSSPARKTGRASPPTRASASRPACRWWKCSNRPACSCKAWPAAACRLPWRTARAMPTSNTGATPTRPLPPCALWTTTARHRAVPVQPQRQPRRPDGGDHGRRPLHGHDAAPRARVPQRPDELDQR